MRLIRKIFNKILFASVVAIVFALFNRCEVKAQEIEYNLPNTDVFFYYDLDTETYPYYIGVITSNPTNHTITFTLYYSSVEFRNAGGQYQYCVPVDSSYPNTICYFTGGKANGINAYAVYYKWDTTNQHLLESNSNSPRSLNYGDIFVLSYYNIQDSLDKGFITYFDNNYYQFKDNVWVPFALSYDINNNHGYIIESDYINGPSSPTIQFSPNYVKVNNLYVAINVLVKVLNYNFTDYKYYYSFVSEEDSENVDYDTLEYTELFEQNFLLLDDEADTTLHFDHNGYLLMKIVDISNDTVVYSTSLHISALSTKEPDIDININYNSGNSTTIDEILIDADYNIYSSNLTGYKCYYLFSNTEIEPSTNDFTETDCSAGRLYVAHSNGYYYARITYNDEIVADVVRNISEYGQLVSTIYSDYSNNIFNKLLGGTNGYLGIFTNNKGPLYSLVSLPLRLGTFIYNFFNSSNFCTPYDFGTIFGQHFTIGCINLSILGSPLLQTIDTIFAGFFTITWGLFLYKLLRRMILLKDISITGLFKGGIF